MSKEVTQLAAERDKAQKVLAAIQDERNSAIAEATQRITEEYRERVTAASHTATRAISAYEAALRAIQEAKTHPWEGKKVVRQIDKSRSRFTTNLVDQFGIVEIRRTGSQFAATTAWHMKPSYGDAYVRILKADGKPSLHIDKLSDRWKRIDDPAAKPWPVEEPA